MKEAKPYHYIRYRWFREVDMKEAKKEFCEDFDIETLDRPPSVISNGFREELKVTADSLTVFLSPKRAVLFQKEPVPFTAKDMALRRRILDLYSRNRITPLHTFFRREPKFEVAEQSH